MTKVSIIIPSKNEKFLGKTIESIINNATGDYEIIVVLDGPTSYPIIKESKKLSIFSHVICQVGCDLKR